MEKRISYAQFQSVKSVAKACDPIIRKREAVHKKVEELVEEYNTLDEQIKALEAGIVQIIGFRVEDLVKKVIESGLDSKGQPTKSTKYLPTDLVTYDAEKKQYVITYEEPAAPEAPQEIEPVEQDTIF